jgi:hypothetical protein
MLAALEFLFAVIGVLVVASVVIVLVLEARDDARRERQRIHEHVLHATSRLRRIQREAVRRMYEELDPRRR